MQWEDDQTIQNCFISSQVSYCKNGEPPLRKPRPKNKDHGDKHPKTRT